MAFRAKLYLAHDVLNEQKQVNVWKDTRGLRRAAQKISEPIAHMVQTIEDWFGAEWMAWLRGRKSHEAFRVQTMAENLGLERWYNAVYRSQSNIAHAGDALIHLDRGDAPRTIETRLSADIEGAMKSLHLANAMCVLSSHIINARFRLALENTLKDLEAGARAVEEGV